MHAGVIRSKRNISYRKPLDIFLSYEVIKVIILVSDFVISLPPPPKSILIQALRNYTTNDFFIFYICDSDR